MLCFLVIFWYICHRYYSFSVLSRSAPCGAPSRCGLVSNQSIQASSPGGDSSYSWVSICALDCNLGKEWAINTSPSQEELRVKRNTPGFILEQFIVLFLDGTQWAPGQGELESNSHGYSAQPHSELKLIVRKKPCKCTINKSYNHIQSYCYNCSTLSGYKELTGERTVRRLPKHLK